jgi:hypothetical protein
MPKGQSCRQLFKNQIHIIKSKFSFDLHSTPANVTNFKNAFQNCGVSMEGRRAGQ